MRVVIVLHESLHKSLSDSMRFEIRGLNSQLKFVIGPLDLCQFERSFHIYEAENVFLRIYNETYKYTFADSSSL